MWSGVIWFFRFIGQTKEERLEIIFNIAWHWKLAPSELFKLTASQLSIYLEQTARILKEQNHNE
jgi:hypothetical protein